MKVRDIMNSTANIQEISSKEEKKVSDSEKTGFKSQLNRVESENYREKIRSLVSRIIEQGEKLGKKVDVKEFKVYKKLISEFLDEAVGNSLKFSKNGFLDRRGRHRVYAVIKKVDEELALLAEEVLKSEKDNIKVLQRLDNIKGLILDISL